MAHERKRHFHEPFEELIRFARIVGVLGHRQVGKTTFVKKVSNEFFTLDDEEVFLRASKSAQDFVYSLKGKKSAIDECQLLPSLFPALKLFVGTSSRPGRFILTGSVRFTSREAIRESLTGRISNLELYPLVISEIEQEELPDFFLKLLKTDHLESFSRSLNLMNSIHVQRMKAVHRYFETGGMPGLLFIRKEQTKQNLLKDVIDTIIDRDVRLVYSTTLPYPQIYDFCKQIAMNPGEPLNYAEMKRQTGISVPTQKKLLRALEGVFLIRSIRMEGDFRGELYWFEDQIERFYFDKGAEPNEWDWIGLVYRNARAQFGYRLGEFPNYSHYQTRGGAQVPLVIQNKTRRVGIFTVSSEKEITPALIRSAESFLKKYNAATVLFLNRDTSAHSRESKTRGERILVAPMSVAFFR